MHRFWHAITIDGTAEGDGAKGTDSANCADYAYPSNSPLESFWGGAYTHHNGYDAKSRDLHVTTSPNYAFGSNAFYSGKGGDALMYTGLSGTGGITAGTGGDGVPVPGLESPGLGGEVYQSGASIQHAADGVTRGRYWEDPLSREP